MKSPAGAATMVDDVAVPAIVATGGSGLGGEAAHGAPIVKNIEVGPSGRRTFDVGAEAPELQNESFGVLAVCTNCNDITVERSIYWDAKGVFWGGGSNAPAAPLSGFTVF